MTREYPTRNGIPIDPYEIGLGVEVMGYTERVTNHHNAWPARVYERMGGSGLLLMELFRDCDGNQKVMWASAHNQGKQSLHALYEPPRPPTIEQAMDFVVGEYEGGRMLKYGTARLPEYKKITPRMMKVVTREYNDR